MYFQQCILVKCNYSPLYNLECSKKFLWKDKSVLQVTAIAFQIRVALACHVSLILGFETGWLWVSLMSDQGSGPELPSV